MTDRLRLALRLPLLATIARAQLLLLLVTALAIGWVRHTRNEAVCRAARLSRILFVRIANQDGQARAGWDLFWMNPDGSGRTRLTHDDLLEVDPVWSPDGRQIAFAAVSDPRSLSSDICVIDADGTRRRRLTRFGDGMVAACPTWSPDGRRIAFSVSRFDGGGFTSRLCQLYVTDADGKNLRRLSRGIAPSWSPDGSSILYTDFETVGRSFLPCLYRMDPEGGTRKLLTAKGELGVWSPDGRQIAYVVDQGKQSALFLANADGSHPKRLALVAQKDDRFRPLGLLWSGDGRRVLFTQYQQGPFFPPDAMQIGAVDVRHQQPVNLTPDGSVSVWEGTGGGRIGSYLVCFMSPVFIRNTALDQALLDAIQRQQTARARALLQKGANPNAKSSFGGIPAVLWAAINTNDPMLVRDLLQHGADPNARDLQGDSLLWWAAARGDLGFVRSLLARGAGGTKEDLSQALEGTAESSLPQVDKRIQVATFLLAHGADVNAWSQRRETVLFAACYSGEPRMVKFLLDHGADVNLAMADGETALMRAARSGQAEAVRILLARGADPRPKNAEGQTALQIATELLLLERGQAGEESYSSCVRLLREARMRG